MVLVGLYRLMIEDCSLPMMSLINLQQKYKNLDLLQCGKIIAKMVE